MVLKINPFWVMGDSVKKVRKKPCLVFHSVDFQVKGPGSKDGWQMAYLEVARNSQFRNVKKNFLHPVELFINPS